MLREAAYLGVPAYSIFKGTIGAVDRYLASIGRLSVLSSASDFSRIRFTAQRSVAPLREDWGGAKTAMAMIVERVEAGGNSRRHVRFAA
jgi:predicted glycosyltransferase